MALFKKKKESTPAPAPAPGRDTATVDIKSKIELVQSGSFKGCKRFQLRSFYLRPEVEQNHAYLKNLGYDFKGKMVTILYGIHSELGECILVHIGGLLIGSLFNSDKYAELFDAIKSNSIDKAHLRIEESEYGTATYLFLHW